MSYSPVIIQEIKLNENEKQVQKYVVAFCKYLPVFIDAWRSIQEEAKKCVRTLCNLSEQLRHVEKASVEDIDNFKEIQNKLVFDITSCIEVELSSMRRLIERLQKSFHDLKNKLSTLEKSSLKLNWEEGCTLIHGTATQPKLPLLLELGLDMRLFATEIHNNVCEAFKSIDVRKEKSLYKLENAFKFDLSDKTITGLMTLTQFAKE